MKSVIEHTVKNGSLGLVLILVEETSPGEGLVDASYQWNVGKTPTTEEIEKAEALISDEAANRALDYIKRKDAAPNIMARWADYNHQKLASGEWSPEDFSTFLGQIGKVVVLLQSLGFGACAAAIEGFNHVLATPEAKADYIQIMIDEYPPLGEQ